MSEELKPLDCPFCGRSNLAVVMSDDLDFNRVECFSCGARGPDEDNRDDAVAAWNKRADSRRCENCEHFDAEVRNDCQWCRALNHAAHPDFFCADFTKRGE